MQNFSPPLILQGIKVENAQKRLFYEVKNESFNFGSLYIQNTKYFEANIHWVFLAAGEAEQI